MSYRVLWSPEAEARLSVLFSRADEVEMLAVIVREIDRRLFNKPDEFGESRYDAVRVGFVRPLGVLFEIHHDIRTVIVYGVWRTDRKS